jgi:hypothetical protein
MISAEAVIAHLFGAGAKAPIFGGVRLSDLRKNCYFGQIRIRVRFVKTLCIGNYDRLVRD